MEKSALEVVVYVTHGKIKNNFRWATQLVAIGSRENFKTVLDQIIPELEELEWDKQMQ